VDSYSTARELWRFSTNSEQIDGILVIALSGRLGAAAAPALTAALAEAKGNGHKRLVLDLANLTYISSAGVVAIEAAAKDVENAGGTLVLRSPQEPVRIAFELAGSPIRVTSASASSNTRNTESA
jgi:anti-sigma B factor antagonist